MEPEMFSRPPHGKSAPTGSEVSEARFKRFAREMEAYERRITYEHTLDGFLDLYSSWKKTHDPVLKLRLVMLAFELNRLDHHFQCDLVFEDQPACVKSSSET